MKHIPFYTLIWIFLVIYTKVVSSDGFARSLLKPPTSGGKGPTTPCPRDVIDTMQSPTLKKCADQVKSLGQIYSQGLKKKKAPLTANDDTVKQILSLPLKLAECVFKTDGYITGQIGAVYMYNTDLFKPNPNLQANVVKCRLSAEGVCPFPDLKADDKTNCLPHPLPFIKCVRENALKYCKGGATPRRRTTPKMGGGDEEDAGKEEDAGDEEDTGDEEGGEDGGDEEGDEGDEEGDEEGDKGGKGDKGDKGDGGDDEEEDAGDDEKAGGGKSDKADEEGGGEEDAGDDEEK